MKKFKNKSIKRSLAIMMICVLCIQFGNVNAFAQQKKSWTLIHSYSGTSGTNINSWSDTAKTTSSTVTIYVDIAAEGYPTIEASVTQGTKNNNEIIFRYWWSRYCFGKKREKYGIFGIL